MLGNYLQQTTSTDDIFKCIFFLGALRVKDFIILNQLMFFSIIVYSPKINSACMENGFNAMCDYVLM